MPDEFSGKSAFRAASREVLTYLSNRHPMSLWMLTRTNGQEWIVLDSQDRSYGVKGGAVFLWSDSFCSRMVQGQGPRVAPDSNQIEAYRNAPIGQQVPISAYVGIPLYDHQQDFFGTLCAIDPQVQDQSLTEALPELELISSLLMRIYECEIERNRIERRALSLSNDNWTDNMTGAYTLRAWEHDVRSADLEIAALAQPGGVIVIDHSFAAAEGAAFVANLQSKLGRATRIYKMGTHEFAILMLNVPEGKQHGILSQLQNFTQSIHIGYHPRRAGETFLECYDKARTLAKYASQAAA